MDAAKKNASYRAVDECIDSNMKVIGIGSGTTVVHCVERIAEKVRNKEISPSAFIPTSFQAKQMIIGYNLQLGDLIQYPEIDIVFDGADEVDSSLCCIKGGGGCHLQEKLVASAGKKCIIVADSTKKSEILGTNWKHGVPIEVHPLAHKLKELGGSPTLRTAFSVKVGPVVTDNGNFILDTCFGLINNPRELESKILQIPGVMEVGLFSNLFSIAYFGHEDGSVIKITSKNHGCN